ncbi:hypothetical protein JSO56_05765 [Riemerella anatipestifer]|uniref:RHS repeat-associated core domain-containing protein n=1 Tax=Riemerella anatipestifer TaxID=34085 RepID=UPI0030C16CDA
MHYQSKIKGNTRLSYYKGSNNLVIAKESNYYPFGLEHTGYNGLLGNQSYNYKYNGKELQTEIGMYDYGARFYMPDLGRWGVVDGLSEGRPNMSPYRFSFNNPVNSIDAAGLWEDWVYNYDRNEIYWNDNATSQATAGVNETYLGKSGTYTAADGSTTALYSDRSHVNNSLLGGLGIMNNLDPLIQAGANGPYQSILAFGTSGDGSYIRETPSLNSSEGAFSNPSSQLAYTTFVAMQQAPFAMATELAITKLGNLMFPTTKVYRSVSPAELADISTNGLRVGETGYATEKLFTTTASDASFFSKAFYPWDKTANTIIQVEVPNSVMKVSGSYMMDGKNVISIPASQLQNIKNVKSLNYSPLPK